ncbi:hypothetical protein GXM_08514 [Nostoc sphaeroides CCNUC1]|uniref:Uncharacterized protein n=1 Tax=Nostoc sphaeroides CCNUC1 TaxID=2653204 RepID=A0A5P8WEJ3_9NOSO|nr:hypothetical protein GXM_08514 [Nostoc sphaeroides CCNUC1]
MCLSSCILQEVMSGMGKALGNYLPRLESSAIGSKQIPLSQNEVE